MKKTFVAATVIATVALSFGTVEARGAGFDGDDIELPNGYDIYDVFDVRDDRDRGRDNDVDVENRGRACRDNSPGADVNCDD